MANTFADLGMPFPLFEAPIKDTHDYAELANCCTCGTKRVPCFKASPLQVKDVKESQRLCCYACLRAGKGEILHDTEFGFVNHDLARQGLTHGVPGLQSEEFELIPSAEDSEWMQVRIPTEHLLELLRTPGFSTWQGDRWLFHCGQPMIYVGEWKEKELNAHAPQGDGLAWLTNVMDLEPEEFSPQQLWDALHRLGGIYMFRCPTCERYRGYWDID